MKLTALLATWRGRFIAAFLAVQILAPLHYYVLRHDKHDERFAWRMFSPTRMMTCNPQFTVDGKPLELGSLFHEGWVEIAKRGRFVVIEAMAAKLCRKQPGSAVTVNLVCKYQGREEAETYGGFDLCQVPEI